MEERRLLKNGEVVVEETKSGMERHTWVVGIVATGSRE